MNKRTVYTSSLLLFFSAAIFAAFQFSGRSINNTLSPDGNGSADSNNQTTDTGQTTSGTASPNIYDGSASSENAQSENSPGTAGQNNKNSHAGSKGLSPTSSTTRSNTRPTINPAVNPAILESTKKTGPECFRATYGIQDRVTVPVRKQLPEFRSLIQLPSKAEINYKSVCIRVDGTPVKKTPYKKQKRSFIIDPTAHAESKIEVTFCTGNRTCKDSCIVPKDDFLIAIGGTDDEIGDLSAKSVGWNGKESTSEEREIQKSSKQIKELLSLGDDSDSKIFNGWAIRDEQLGCLTQVGASN